MKKRVFSILNKIMLGMKILTAESYFSCVGDIGYIGDHRKIVVADIIFLSKDRPNVVYLLLGHPVQCILCRTVKYSKQ